MRRTLTLLAVVTGLVLLPATPASAHPGGEGASDFVTRLVSFGPGLPPGLTLRVVEHGERLELVNHSGQEVIVLGYVGEPYLRVTARGVDENRRSSATYLNAADTTDVPVPAAADNAGTSWKHVGDAPIARWHDHRIHWMSTGLPVVVAADPGVPRVVYGWTVHFLVGGRPVSARGTLNWEPAPSPVPAYLLIITGFGGLAWLGWRRPRLIPLGLVALAGADAVHRLGTALDRAGTTLPAALLAWPAGAIAGLVGSAVGLLALIAAGLLATGRRRPAATVLALLATGWMTVLNGLGQWAVLHHSSAPFAWPVGLARALTGVEIAAGEALLLVLVRALLLLRADLRADVRADVRSSGQLTGRPGSGPAGGARAGESAGPMVDVRTIKP